MDAAEIVGLVCVFVGIPFLVILTEYVSRMLAAAFGKPPVENRQPIEIDWTPFWDAFDNTLGNMLGGGVSRKRKNDEIDDRLNEILHDPHFDEKPKRDEEPEETEWYVGDDGELFERKRKR